MVVGYNIPELAAAEVELILSLDTLIGIYNGSIIYWNDTQIQALNLGVDMPNETIKVLARGDSSGTTDIYTKYLSKSPYWRNQYGSFKSQSGWAEDAITFFAYHSRGMTGLMLSFEYSVGYVSVGEAIEAGVPFAGVVNYHGEKVRANFSSVQSVIDQAVSGGTADLETILTDLDSPQGYPIAGFTYLIVYMTDMEDCALAKELVRYIDWFLSYSTADDDCKLKEMTPLSVKMKSTVRKVILEQIACGGVNMWKMAQNDIEEENKEENNWLLSVSVSCSVVGCILIIGAARLAVYLYKYKQMLDNNSWLILIEDVVFFHTSRPNRSGQCRFTLWPSITSLTELDDVDEGYLMLEHILQWPGKYNSQTVGLRLLEVKGLVHHVSRQERMLLLSFKDNLNHLNVLKFMGITQIEADWYVVSEYSAKGCLTDILKDKKMTLNKDFKFSLSFDIVSGISYLHSKGIVHGCLKSSCCLIDFRWTVKIADWEFLRILSETSRLKSPLLGMRKNPDEIGVNEASFHNYWSAPEVLQADFVIMPSLPMDIYSYSIIIQEVFTREDPYVEHADTVSPQEVIKAIIDNKLRPAQTEDVPGTIRHIQECAWSEEPSKRPSAEHVIKMIRAVHSFKRSVIDAMMETAEEYTSSLEEKLTCARQELNETRETLVQYNDRLLFPTFKEQPNIDGCKSGGITCRNSVQRVNACIICIKCKHNIVQGNLWSALNNLDMMLEHFSNVYNAHRLDIGSGVFLLILTTNTKSTLHVVNSAKLCLQLIHCSTELLDGIPGSDKLFGFQIAIHKGSIFVCYLNNYMPKTYVLGENVELVNTLVENSQVNKILLSKSFYEALDTFAKGVFNIEKTSQHTNGVSRIFDNVNQK